MIPLLPGAAILSMLVMLGDDLGTTFILLVIFLALLWVIGTPARLMIGILALMGFAMVRFTYYSGPIPYAPYALFRWRLEHSLG